MASHFKIGDLVWAKMKGFPSWPGRIIEPKPEVKRPTNKKPQQFVFFFGSENYAWILEENLWLYAQNKTKFMPSTRIPKGFKEAIEAIDDALKAEPEQENYKLLELPSIEEELAQIFPGRSSPIRETGRGKKRKMVDTGGDGSAKGKTQRATPDQRRMQRPKPTKKAGKIGMAAVRTSRSDGTERGRSSVGAADEEETMSSSVRRRAETAGRRQSTVSSQGGAEDLDQDYVQIIEDEEDEDETYQEQQVRPMPRRQRSGSDKTERRSVGLERIRRDTAPASYDLNNELIPSQVHVINAEEAIGVNGGGRDLPKGLGVRIEGEPGQTTTVITLTDEHGSLADNRSASSSSQSVIERVQHYDIQDSNFYVNVVETLNTGDIEGGSVAIETVDDQGNVIFIEGDKEQTEGDSNNILGEKNNELLEELERNIAEQLSEESTACGMIAETSSESQSKSPRPQRNSQEPRSPSEKRPEGVGQPRDFQKKTKDMMHIKKRPPSPSDSTQQPATKKSRLINKVPNTPGSASLNSPPAVKPAATNHRRVSDSGSSEEYGEEVIASSALDKSAIIPTPLKIGFLGLGIMGRGMANNLLQSGHEVTVWNRTGTKCRDIIKEGALRGNSPADVVTHCDITFSCVSDPTALREIVFGNQGVLQGIRAGKGYVDMSTVDPDTIYDVAEAVTARGGRFLEAPVSGSKGPANSGELIILAAGDLSLFEDCKSCFQSMGKKAFFLGRQTSHAVKMKLVLNLLMGTMIAGLSEAMALTQNIGMDQDDFMQILEVSAISCPLLRAKGQAIMGSKFDAQFPLQHQQKDLRLAINMADSIDQPLHVGAAANELFKKAKAKGYGEHDVAAVYRAADA